MRKTILVFIIAFLVTPAVTPHTVYGGILRNGSGYVPRPRLLSPVAETVVMTGKDALEFRWNPHESMPPGRKYYDFRLYRGYRMVESTLIFKERIPGDHYSITLASDRFTRGQTYTWSLRMVYPSIGKSSRSTQTFKCVITPVIPGE